MGQRLGEFDLKNMAKEIGRSWDAALREMLKSLGLADLLDDTHSWTEVEQDTCYINKPGEMRVGLTFWSKNLADRPFDKAALEEAMKAFSEEIGEAMKEWAEAINEQYAKQRFDMSVSWPIYEADAHSDGSETFFLRIVADFRWEALWA